MEKHIIFDKISKQHNGNYVHVLEVESIEDIDNCIAEIVNTFYNDGVEAIKEFFNTMEIIYIGDDKNTENQVYNYITDKLIENFYS